MRYTWLQTARVDGVSTQVSVQTASNIQHSNIRRLSLISIAKEVFWSRLLLSGRDGGFAAQLTLPSSLRWSLTAETEAPGK